MSLALPKLYAIADRETLDRRGLRLSSFAGEMARAGVRLLQLRDKVSAPQEVLRGAAAIAGEFEGTDARLVMNDRADLAVLAGWSAVHVGHLDMPPAAVRRVFGQAHSLVGVSTHNDEQVRVAEASCADYVAVGPVFTTSTKSDAEPVIGLEGVRRARALTRKPIVAIGGITRENVRSVVDAGADSVAVVGGFFARGERPGQVAEELLRLLD